MSTRRARIKAVAALPPRRKNTESVDGSKNKQVPPKETAEKALKSPNTPRPLANTPEEKNSPVEKTLPRPLAHTSEEKNSPVVNTLPQLLTNTPEENKSPVVKTLRPAPQLIPISRSKTPLTSNNVISSINTPISSKLTPGPSEKVPVITSVSSTKCISNIFASPPAKNLPDLRIASPLVPPSPKPVKSIQKSALESLKADLLREITDGEPVVGKNNEAANKAPSVGKKNDIPDAKNLPDLRIASPLVPLSPRPAKSIQKSALESLKADLLREIRDRELIVGKNNEAANKTPSVGKKNDIPDDYSIPSVPESITDETVDGIIPLQKERSAPNPIDVLKNEIISECAEVLFDPIVPLPSPSKVRPKLRPVPRLAPHRRNSVQGSASESEDDSRRAHLNSGAATPAPPRQRHDSHTSHSTLHSVPHREVNRIRNDSICSTVSQVTIQPPPATSPVKEKHVSKARRQEMSRRMWRRRRETVKRDALTMYDLIFYNPTTNPIIPDQEEIKAKEANAKDEAERQAKTQEIEEEVDDPPAAAAPVPQIKLGPNGEIMLDEKSLVIKQSDSDRKVSSVVREGAWGSSNGGRYTRATRTAEWSQVETVRFYRALAAIGTDFTLMAPLFPDRNRKDLKLKFKKEERLNGAQVDKALRSATTFDVVRLQDEFRHERAEAARQAEANRLILQEHKKAERERIKAAKELRVRHSKGSKALESSMDPTNMEMTADAFIQRAMETRHSKRAERKQIRTVKEPNVQKTPSPFATLTLMNKQLTPLQNKATSDMATISRVLVDKPNIPGVPSNIESGSLVVLRVNDPKSPSKTILQTYIAHGEGKLTPVALPSTFLNSVVGYMKKGTPKSGMSTGSSPQLTSPSSAASQDSRSCTPGVIQFNPSPAKRQRHSSYTITSL